MSIIAAPKPLTFLTSQLVQIGSPDSFFEITPDFYPLVTPFVLDADLDEKKSLSLENRADDVRERVLFSEQKESNYTNELAPTVFSLLRSLAVDDTD